MHARWGPVASCVYFKLIARLCLFQIQNLVVSCCFNVLRFYIIYLLANINVLVASCLFCPHVLKYSSMLMSIFWGGKKQHRKRLVSPHLCPNAAHIIPNMGSSKSIEPKKSMSDQHFPEKCLEKRGKPSNCGTNSFVFGGCRAKQVCLEKNGALPSNRHHNTYHHTGADPSLNRYFVVVKFLIGKHHQDFPSSVP